LRREHDKAENGGTGGNDQIIVKPRGSVPPGEQPVTPSGEPPQPPSGNGTGAPGGVVAPSTSLAKPDSSAPIMPLPLRPTPSEQAPSAPSDDNPMAPDTEDVQ
jgi:hypothetical protein